MKQIIKLACLSILALSFSIQTTEAARRKVLIKNPDTLINISEKLGKKNIACRLNKRNKLIPGSLIVRKNKTFWINLVRRLRELKRNINSKRDRKRYRRLRRKVRQFRKSCSSQGGTNPTPTPTLPPYVEVCSNDFQCSSRGPGFFCNNSSYCEYRSPIGIPKAPFGVEQSYRMYDKAENRNPALTYYENSEGGYYTHYIDDTDPNCSDSSEFGTEQVPRCSIPFMVWTLPAGSVAEVHGGPYIYRRHFWQMQGTSTYPVFIRGYHLTNRVRITANGQSSGGVYPQGTYGIVENFDFYHSKPVIVSHNSGDGRSIQSSYIAVRNCEVHNPDGFTGASGTNLLLGEDYKISYNNHIHHNVRESNGSPRDSHGIHSTRGSSNHWVLDNEINHNSGDGYQACHGCSDDPPSFIYIGRNTFHDDFENAVDFKYIEDVVVSENKMYSYSHSSDTGITSPVVIGSDGGSTRTWFIFNEIYDSNYGIRIEEAYDPVILGNVFYNLSGRAINLEKIGQNVEIIGNTFHNTDTVIDQSWRSTFNLNIINNIFSAITNRTFLFESTTVINNSSFYNNLFWQGGNPAVIEWGNNNVQYPSTTESLNTLLGGQNNLLANPVLSGSLELGATSAAINNGIYDSTVQAVFDRYQSTFGQNIKVDLNRKARPQGSAWDIGAFEY